MKSVSLLAHFCFLVSLAGFTVLSTGCSKSAEETTQDAAGEVEHADDGHADDEHTDEGHADEGHDHDGDDHEGHDHDGDAAEGASE